MALNKDGVAIIDAVAAGDLGRARACALAAIANDTAKSREWWRKTTTAKLKASPSDVAELPSDLQGMLVVEDPSQSFQVGRFTLGGTGAEAVSHVRRMRKACDRLTSLGIRYANATLLHGEPGTGKTMLGRYIAYENGLPFAYVSFARLVDAYMGATARNVSRAFQFCAGFPCVLMLDEVDTIAGTRSAAHDGAAKELGRVTVTLMQELDRAPASMVVIGATNRADMIDPALMRRFTRHFEVRRPEDMDDVHAIVENYLDDCGLCYDVDEMERVVDGWRGPCPTQAETVTALVEAIADHELRGLARTDPVDVAFLRRLMRPWLGKERGKEETEEENAR